MSLSDLGFSPQHETLYRVLLSHPTSSLDQLNQDLAWSQDELRATFDDLLEFGVIKPDPNRRSAFLVLQPAAAIGSLIERREEELLREYQRASRSRSILPELEELYAQTAQNGASEEGIERLEDLHAVRRRVEELAYFARTFVYSVQPGGPQTRESLEAARPLALAYRPGRGRADRDCPARQPHSAVAGLGLHR